MQTPHLMIFCDGGIGNRINALVSGLALAAPMATQTPPLMATSNSPT
jgi:hypothetical protein